MFTYQECLIPFSSFVRVSPNEFGEVCGTCCAPVDSDVLKLYCEGCNLVMHLRAPCYATPGGPLGYICRGCEGLD